MHMVSEIRVLFGVTGLGEARLCAQIAEPMVR